MAFERILLRMEKLAGAHISAWVRRRMGGSYTLTFMAYRL
jgi:hypothetical protein